MDREGTDRRVVNEWMPEADWWPDLPRHGPKPRRIAGIIRRLVREKQIPVWRPVPGAFRIARRYGVTSATACKALAMLVDEGVLVHAHGHRYVVVDQQEQR